MRALSLLELSLRLAVAATAGGLLGLEREVRGRPAGVRTHALVAVGAALFTVAGAYGFADIPRAPSVDPSRLAAQVASGVGFLGAGAILRHGSGVRGLTTAATVWLAAAVGVTSGAGAYAAVAIATAVVLLVLVVMRAAKPLLSHWSAPVTVIEVEYRRGHGTLGPFIRDLNEVAGRLEDLEISDPETEAELRRVSLRVTTPELAAVDKAVDRLRSRDEVLDVRVERPHAGHPD